MTSKGVKIQVSTRKRNLALISLGTLLSIAVSACASNDFQSSWKSSLEFVAGTDTITVLNPNRTTKTVTHGDAAAWGPSHKYLIVSQTYFGISPPSDELWLIGLNGQKLKKLTAVYPDQVRFFAVGSRGRDSFVVYDTDNKMQLVDIRSGRVQTLIASGAGNIDALAISRDGTKILYTSGPGGEPSGLYVMSTQGSTPHRILDPSRYRYIAWPSWSPSGEWIAFTMTVYIGPEEISPLSGIWMIRPDGHDMHFVTKGLNATWSPDGGWLGYIGGTQGVNISYIDPSLGRRAAIFAIRPNGGKRLRLTPWKKSDIDAPSTSSPLSW